MRDLVFLLLTASILAAGNVMREDMPCLLSPSRPFIAFLFWLSSGRVDVEEPMMEPWIEGPLIVSEWLRGWICKRKRRKGAAEEENKGEEKIE